jgi:hypothetical protein
MTLPILRLLGNPPTDMFLAALGIQLYDFADFTSAGQLSSRPVLAALGQLSGQLPGQLSSQLLGQLSIQLSGQLSGIIGACSGIGVRRK